MQCVYVAVAAVLADPVNRRARPKSITTPAALTITRRTLWSRLFAAASVGSTSWPSSVRHMNVSGSNRGGTIVVHRCEHFLVGGG
jgi:hypothetical protein